MIASITPAQQHVLPSASPLRSWSSPWLLSFIEREDGLWALRKTLRLGNKGNREGGKNLAVGLRFLSFSLPLPPGPSSPKPPLARLPAEAPQRRGPGAPRCQSPRDLRDRRRLAGSRRRPRSAPAGTAGGVGTAGAGENRRCCAPAPRSAGRRCAPVPSEAISSSSELTPQVWHHPSGCASSPPRSPHPGPVRRLVLVLHRLPSWPTSVAAPPPAYPCPHCPSHLLPSSLSAGTAGEAQRTHGRRPWWRVRVDLHPNHSRSVLHRPSSDVTFGCQGIVASASPAASVCGVITFMCRRAGPRPALLNSELSSPFACHPEPAGEGSRRPHLAPNQSPSTAPHRCHLERSREISASPAAHDRGDRRALGCGHPVLGGRAGRDLSTKLEMTRERMSPLTCFARDGVLRLRSRTPPEGGRRFGSPIPR